MHRSVWHTVAVLVVAAGAAATLAWTQGSMARLLGVVRDPTGGVVPAVDITATNDETGVTTKTVSGDTGSYSYPSLAPGTYTVTASKAGFKTFRRQRIRLETADVQELDLQLEIGALADTITVAAESPLLETTTATLGQVMNQRMMQEMPMNSRRSLNLIATAGAAVFLAGGEQSMFSLAGGRSRNQNFMLDGGNIQNVRLALAQVDTDPPVAAVREFRVLSNNYSAEYGGGAGGLVISTTKSGTNTLRGSAYEYFRNDALEAANFFAPVENGAKVKAPRRYNLFGATLGGPVIRNRTHFFFSYEGIRHSVGGTSILTVPAQEQRRGDFSRTFANNGQLVRIYDPASTRTEGGRTVRTEFPGNTIPASRFDAVARQLIQYWPEPNKAAVNLAGAQNFASTYANRRNRDNIVARIDHVFSDANRFYWRYVWGRDPVRNGSVYPDPTADSNSALNSDRDQHTMLFADTHTWSPAVLMDLRYTFGLRKNHEKGAGLGSDIINRIGLKGVPAGGFPAITLTGFAAMGSSRERAQFPLKQHQFINTWSWLRGNHFVRLGGEARQSNNYERARPSISGTYAFAPTGTGQPGVNNTGIAFASFLVGFGNSFSLRDSEVLDRYSWYYSWFVQDDWKVMPSLTLNLGLRWEVDTPMADRNNRMNSFDPVAINPVSGTPGVVRFAGVNGWPTSGYDADLNNFGPRFGFAWQPGRKAWVVRGGFGVFFEHPLSHAAPNANTLGFEIAGDMSSPDNGVTPAFVLGNGIQGLKLGSPVLDDRYGAVRVGASPNTNVTFFERDRPAGYAMQYNFGIQRELRGNMVAEVTYLANLGRKMPNSDLTINQVPPSLMGPGNAQVRRPFPQFNNVSIRVPMIGYMNYHAALLRLEKRFSHGLSFLTTYTWSRNIGLIDHESAGDVGDNQLYQDFYNRSLDKGPNAIDIVHRYTLSSIYDLPFGKGRRWLNSGILSRVIGGWTTSVISTIQSGGPFTVVTNQNTANAFSAGAQRANVIRGPNLPASERTVYRWFDTDAFVAPPPNTFGNAGRGIVRADGRVNFDLSLNKRFAITERLNARFTGELFNAFNHPDFAPPNRQLGNAAFATISDAVDGRVVQLGLNLEF